MIMLVNFIWLYLSEHLIFKYTCYAECLNRKFFKKMDYFFLLFLGDFIAVQLYLHREHKKVLPKLSEGHTSVVIIVNKLYIYCYRY